MNRKDTDIFDCRVPRARSFPGGLPLHVLRPGGVRHQQRDDDPVPGRYRAVEEQPAVSAEWLRALLPRLHRLRGPEGV